MRGLRGANFDITVLRRRGLLVAMFALASCDSDSTPIVEDTAANGSGEKVVGRDTEKLGPNDRVRIELLDSRP